MIDNFNGLKNRYRTTNLHKVVVNKFFYLEIVTMESFWYIVLIFSATQLQSSGFSARL